MPCVSVIPNVWLRTKGEVIPVTELQDVFHNAPFGIVVTRVMRDAAGLPVGCLVEQTNQVFADQLGAERAALVGRPLSELFSDWDPLAEFMAWGGLDDQMHIVRAETVLPHSGRRCAVTAYVPAAHRVVVMTEEVTGTQQLPRRAAGEQVDQNALLQQTPHVLLLCGVDGQIHFANQLAADFFDQETDQLRRQTLQELAASEAPGMSRILKWFEWSMDERRPGHWELELRRPTGAANFQVDMFPKTQGTSVANVLIVISDTSRRRGAERALRTSEARLRAILEQQRHLICRFDAQGVITFVNRAYCSYFEASQNAILGTSFTDHMLDDDAAAFFSQIAELTPEDPEGTVEVRFLARSKGVRWHRWTVVKIADADVEFPEYQAVGADITEDKLKDAALERSQQHLETMIASRTEQLSRSKATLQLEMEQHQQTAAVLRQEKELLRTILESVSEGLVSTDDLGRITGMNTPAEKIMGVALRQVKGRELEPLLRPDRAQGPDAAGAPSPWFPDAQILVRPDGSRRLVTVEQNPVAPPDSLDVLRSVWVLKDVTAHAEMDRRLRLEQKLSALGRLASGVAHELNTPMQYIGDNINFLTKVWQEFTEGAYSSILNTDGGVWPSLSQAEQSRLQYYSREVPVALKESLFGITHASEIIGALKEFAHPSQEQMAWVKVGRLINNALKLSRNEWKHFADLELNLAPDLPEILCAAGEIQQVLLTLIVNAAQSMAAAQQDGLSERGRLSIGTSRTNGSVRITITDNGVGIAPEHREQIFEPFFTTKAVGSGTGQGLAIAYDIVVQKHHGRLSVEAPQERGAVLVIELPVSGGTPEGTRTP